MAEDKKSDDLGAINPAAPTKQEDSKVKKEEVKKVIQEDSVKKLKEEVSRLQELNKKFTDELNKQVKEYIKLTYRYNDLVEVLQETDARFTAKGWDVTNKRELSEKLHTQFIEKYGKIYDRV